MNTSENLETAVVEEPTEPEKTADPEETEKPAEPEDKFSAKFEDLTRREKDLRQRSEAFKANETEYQELKTLRGSAKDDVLGHLEKVGITYDDIANALVNNPEEPDKVSELESRISKFEEAEQKRGQELQQQTAQQEMTDYVGKLNEFIDTSEQCELIKATQSQQTVIDTITEHYQNTEQELEWDVACKLVEDSLWKTEVERAERVLKIQKFKDRVGFSNETKLPSLGVKKPTRTKTLSNTNTAGVADRHEAGKPLTFEESLERAKRLEKEFKAKS